MEITLAKQFFKYRTIRLGHIEDSLGKTQAYTHKQLKHFQRESIIGTQKHLQAKTIPEFLLHSPEEKVSRRR